MSDVIVTDPKTIALNNLAQVVAEELEAANANYTDETGEADLDVTTQALELAVSAMVESGQTREMIMDHVTTIVDEAEKETGEKTLIICFQVPKAKVAPLIADVERELGGDPVAIKKIIDVIAVHQPDGQVGVMTSPLGMVTWIA